MSTITEELREYMRRLGQRGGLSVSAKAKAARAENARKAGLARLERLRQSEPAKKSAK